MNPRQDIRLSFHGFLLSPGSPMRLRQVPDVFPDLDLYCETILHNLYVEYQHFFSAAIAEASEAALQSYEVIRTFSSAGVDNVGKFVEFSCGTASQELHNHLVWGCVSNGGHGVWLVKSKYSEDKPCDSYFGFALKADFPDARNSGAVQLHDMGFVGSFLESFVALTCLRASACGNAVVRSILNPTLRLPGEYVNNNVREVIKTNASQRECVSGLSFALECVQGPPGTGKSTTICSILQARIPSSHNVLVTCSRNGAVESIVEKLVRCFDAESILAVGDPGKIGKLTLSLTLPSKLDVYRAYVEAKFVKVRAMFKRFVDETRGIFERDGNLRGLSQGKGSLDRWCVLVARLRNMMRLVQLREHLFDINNFMEKKETLVDLKRKKLLSSFRIVVSTIASVHKIFKLERTPLKIDTILVDECGCVDEGTTASLLLLEPKNFILVGDHKQLPPFSYLKDVGQTGHNRSLLERCVTASGRVHLLCKQYRMPRELGDYISTNFYEGNVRTDRRVALDRERGNRLVFGPNFTKKGPVRWIDDKSREDANDGFSVSNKKQAVKVLQAVSELVQALKGQEPWSMYRCQQTVAILTFYREQKSILEELVESNFPGAFLENNPKCVQVMTVDTCQGCEFDHVFISLVRSNKRGIVGFCKNPQRVNVALSRAKYTLTLVGDREFFKGKGGAHWQSMASVARR